MTELDAIKARAAYTGTNLNEYEPSPFTIDTARDLLMLDVPALVAAVEAVLELHEPEATGYGDWVCGACISAGSHDWESTAYPCPTVTAIHSALGEGEK